MYFVHAVHSATGQERTELRGNSRQILIEKGVGVYHIEGWRETGGERRITVYPWHLIELIVDEELNRPTEQAPSRRGRASP